MVEEKSRELDIARFRRCLSVASLGIKAIRINGRIYWGEIIQSLDGRDIGRMRNPEDCNIYVCQRLPWE